MTRSRRVLLPTAALLLCVLAQPTRAHHRARLDPTEPIFTQRSFVEKNLEYDTGWDRQADRDEVELSAGASWVFWERLELDLEIPVGLAIPADAATVGSLGDVAAGTQLMLCCRPGQLLDYLSLRLDLAAPTGSRAKGLGGTGAWSASLLPGRLFTVADALPDLFVQGQLAYGEDLRPSAASLPREKALVWNLAFAQQYLAGRLRPVAELLGTSVLEAAPGDAGTIVELAVGGWMAPFADDLWLSPLSIGMGWKWPVTARRESEVTGVLLLEWSFGQ